MKILETEPVKTVRAEKGRGRQFNSGYGIASGEILIFLHSDTVFPENGLKITDEYFKSGKNIVAAFRLKFSPDSLLLNLYSFFTRFDSMFTTFGDQCILLRRDTFELIGRFPDWPLFEDVNLFQKLRKITKIKKLKSYVITSPRRFLSNGILRQQLRNFILILKYLAGTTPGSLEKHYKS